MKRRQFLQQSAQAAAGAALLPGLVAGCASPGQPAEQPAAAGAAETPFALAEATFADLQARQANGQATARALAEQYLARIAQLNQKGPALRAVIETNPDALALADQLDQERKAGKLRGPLHGIPILVKDNFDTGDKMITSAGSLALAQHRAAHDAFVVKKLREAGAVLLGKTNLSEWANFRSTHSASGWSSRGGQTRNPYAPLRTPSGSSSGSGAAVAANLCAGAIGTETDGSITAPASCCGLVGLKPTVGLLSRRGIIPISASQDTAGPMTRTVQDAALLLGALAGADPDDAATAGQPAAVDYAAGLRPNALRGQRMGVEKSHLQGPPGPSALLRAALDVLKKQGATVVEVDVLRHTRPLGDAEYDVLLYEFKEGLNRYLTGANAPAKTLADLIAFNRQHAAEVMPYFQQEIFEAAEKTEGLSSPRYRAALAKSQTGARQALDNALKKDNLAAVVAITAGPAGFIDVVNGDYGPGPDFTSPAAMAGYPHLTVPMGQVHGLPVGLSFVGPAYAEAKLLGLGYAYERATRHRQAPKLSAAAAG